jgi:HNH endonuclease
MSVTYVNAELRRLVVARAEGVCEYCLIAEEDTFYGCAIDHIISEKHGGPTQEENLSYSCVFCNQTKGSDVGSIHWESKQFVRFYNPRSDRWDDHFVLAGIHIEALTDIGAVTARILRFNDGERLLEREILRQIGRYPNSAARKRMREKC